MPGCSTKCECTLSNNEGEWLHSEKFMEMQEGDGALDEDLRQGPRQSASRFDVTGFHNSFRIVLSMMWPAQSRNCEHGAGNTD